MADTPAQAALRAAFSSKLSVIAQTLSAEQQQQARTNIGAISSTDLTNALTPYLTTANAQATYLGINATAQSANQWATARTISLSGDATGSVSINGAADATLPLTIANGAVFSMVNSGDVATQAEAEAGTANNSFMTPLRVAQAIDALAPQNWVYDYSATTSLTVSTSEQTATQDGLLVASILTTINSVQVKLYIDGAEVAFLNPEYSGAEGNLVQSKSVPIFKGQKYKFSTTTNVNWLNIAPLVRS